MFCSSLSFAQVSDKHLHEAWQREDMTVWAQYLDSMSWGQMSQAERTIYLNYEYGYVALVAEGKIKDNTEARIDTFAQHIMDLRYYLQSAPFMAYRAAECAFRAKSNALDLIPMGLKAQRLIHAAFRYDAKDPFALTVAGALDFYTPPLFGGSRTRAMNYFKQAAKNYEMAGDTINNWNYTVAKSPDKFFDIKTK